MPGQAFWQTGGCRPDRTYGTRMRNREKVCILRAREMKFRFFPPFPAQNGSSQQEKKNGTCDVPSRKKAGKTKEMEKIFAHIALILPTVQKLTRELTAAASVCESLVCKPLGGRSGAGCQGMHTFPWILCEHCLSSVTARMPALSHAPCSLCSTARLPRRTPALRPGVVRALPGSGFWQRKRQRIRRETKRNSRAYSRMPGKAAITCMPECSFRQAQAGTAGKTEKFFQDTAFPLDITCLHREYGVSCSVP